MKTILVIEDDTLVRDTTLDLLEVEGFRALGATNGQEGVELARQELPDLILCDIMMPALDGYEVLAKLRASAKTATIPFIFLTAKADQPSLRQGMEKGAEDYLTKPFSLDQLLAAINTQLQKHEAVARLYWTEFQQVEDKLYDLAYHQNLDELGQIAQILGAEALVVYSINANKVVTDEPLASYPNPWPSSIQALLSPEAMLYAYQKQEAAYYRLEDHRSLAYLPLLRGEKMLGVMVIFLRARSEEKEWMDGELQRLLLLAATQIARSLERTHLSQESAQISFLKETNQWQSTLLASVSHELRTPLNSIKTAVVGLQDEQVALEPAEQQEYLQIIESEVDRLDRFISGLLSYSRIEAGLLHPDKGLFYLPEIINEVLDRLKRNSILGEHPVSTRFEKNLPLIPADYLQLEQVLTNLLENAAKYSPATGPISIEVAQAVCPFPDATEIKASQMGVQVKINDQGGGIPETDRQRIFEKFYRAERPGEIVAGYGVGLAICKGIIEAHAGQIWVEQGTDNEGSSFVFWLPL